MPTLNDAHFTVSFFTFWDFPKLREEPYQSFDESIKRCYFTVAYNVKVIVHK